MPEDESGLVSTEGDTPSSADAFACEEEMFLPPYYLSNGPNQIFSYS